MEKNTGKKVITQGKHREFYLDWNVATLVLFGTWYEQSVNIVKQDKHFKHL